MTEKYKKMKGESNPAKRPEVREKIKKAKKGKIPKNFYIGMGSKTQFKSGKNHWNYKGGLAFNKWIRGSVEYKEWRLQVLKRDNFTCVNCGKVGGYLEVHHIKSFSEYPNLRFDIDNGITFCLDCHHRIKRRLH